MAQAVAEILVALAVVTLALVLALRLTARQRAGLRAPATGEATAPTTFLFRGGQLLDVTPPARILLSRLPGRDLTALLIWLEQRLPGAADTMRRALEDGLAEQTGSAGHGSARLRLVAEALGDDTLRLTLIDPDAAEGGIVVDTLSQRALEEEAAILREAMDGAPILAWRQDATGAITWANHAYIAMAELQCAAGDTPLWPLPRVIALTSLAEGAAPAVVRHELASGDGTLWFDCHIQRVGMETIVFALPADATVRAERSLREFVQTLSKTFADLPIGLAIFDRNRNLQLFNPALIDLTNLSAGVLIGKPSLYAFLDQLREHRIIPEPRDYRTWRKRIATLEAAAAQGHHVETWSLPGGQTYRVTGRPHPDGAIAFLFEDITSEMTLSRRFRADISLGVNALDALGDAVAVFGGDGAAVLTNALWRESWGEGASLATLAAVVEARLGEAPAGLPRLADHMAGSMVRAAAEGGLMLSSGHLLRWRAAPMPAGRVLVGFSGDGLEDALAPTTGARNKAVAEVIADAAPDALALQGQ